MQARYRFALPVLVVLFLLFAGCIHPLADSTTPATAAQTIVTPLPPTAATACSLTPGPRQTLPAYEDVSITVDRNTITDEPTITVRFDGGLGNGMVQRMTVTIIRSDCVTEQQFRDNPVVGTSITQMGTLGTDRVIVVLVMTSGDQYTVIDQDYPFPVRMG
jgi:hypothetical protein